MPSIRVHAYDHGSANSAPLPDVWVYWKLGGSVTTLRTDATGLLLAADVTASSAEPYPTKEMPWVYTAAFDVAYHAVAEVAFSRGAKPLPPARLPINVYITVVVGTPWPDPFEAPENTWPEELWIQCGAKNAVGWMFTLDILLPNHKTEITVPHELSIWPLLTEILPPTSDYYTEGLPQGAAIWTTTTNFAGEDNPVAPVAAANRPKEIGLRIAGSIESRVAGLDLVLLDAKGLPILLKTSAAANATLPQFPVVLNDAGANKTFTADLWLARAEDALGAVQAVFQSKGAVPEFADAYFLQLTGLQLGLVDDYNAAAGALPGPVLLEAGDRMVVDFEESPQASLAALKSETRARRMAPYDMHLRNRPFSAAFPARVEMPEMPLWMAEMQFVGIGKIALRELLDFRKHLLPDKPDSLEFTYDWDLTLLWDGPDADLNCAHNRSYSYSQTWGQNGQTATVKLGGDMEISTALAPAPARITFPVAGRREPVVRMETVKRRWGRQAAAIQLDTMIIEWQPHIISPFTGEEIMRGGDGILTLDSLAFDDIGVVPPAVNDPVASLPRFRMQGANPVADLAGTIDLVVEEYFNAHGAEAAVAALSLATWQYTVRKILTHEARNTQFGFLALHYGTGADGGTDYYYGLERHMPLFGYPHGYGMGQLDNPRVDDDGAWSYIGNLRGSVRLLLGDKAAATHALLSQHEEDTGAWRAAYQRDVIKQYNSGKHEFTWSGGAWKISPDQDQTTAAGAANPELQYPNLVLDDQTDVIYWTGSAVAPVFNWPITFLEANYGELPD